MPKEKMNTYMIRIFCGTSGADACMFHSLAAWVRQRYISKTKQSTGIDCKENKWNRSFWNG